MNRIGATESRRTSPQKSAASSAKDKSRAKGESKKAAPKERAAREAVRPPAGDVAIVSARPSRAERASADERMRRIDEVCAAWAAIVAERMAADQQFTELYVAYRTRSSDVRGLFAWDALSAAEAHLSIVNSALAREQVRGQMAAMGVDPPAVDARVARLTDSELRSLADRMEQMPAGGDALAVIGIVFVILIILELVGVIDIFKKA